MNAAISYDSPGEDLTALWLVACAAEMALEAGTGSAEDAAAAWAKVAAACTRVAPVDAAIFGRLAYEAERRRTEGT